MKKNNVDNTVGRKVYNTLEKKVAKTSGFRLFAEEKASDLLLQSPLIVDVLRQHGLLKEDEHHAKFIAVYKANLACQRFGVIDGDVEYLTTKYAADRAKAIVEYLQRVGSPLIADLKLKDITIHKFYYALRDLILKETLQTDFIAGVELKPETEIVTGIAVNKRMIESSNEYSGWLKLADINPNDDSELRDVVRQTKYRGFVVSHFEDDPFYARRDKPIIAKRESITDNIKFTNVEAETAPLFGNQQGKTKSEFMEKTFIHFVDTLGIDRNKLIRLLAQ